MVYLIDLCAECRSHGWHIAPESIEVESGKRGDRAQPAAAKHRAQVTGAVLVVAKLDRLSRNVAFLASSQDSGTRFLAADMPEAIKLTVHIMAAVAQTERKAIGTRTRDALAVAKARGVKLGKPDGAAALQRASKYNGVAVAAIRTCPRNGRRTCP